MQRAFSLVEALAATALLAVLAVACMPILRASATATLDPARVIDPGALGALADRVALNPAAFGLGDAHATVVIPWPDDLAHDAPAASAVLHAAPVAEGTEEPQAMWLVVSCGPRSAVRWLPAPSVPPTPPAAPPRQPERRLSTRRTTRREVRRGLTLIETLAALAVTAMLAVAVVGWAVASVQAAARSGQKMRDAAAAEGVLRLIREDVASGDTPLQARNSADARREARVTADGGSLVVRGRRHPGAATRTYRHDPRRQAIVAADATARGDRRSGSEEVIATGVRAFTVHAEHSGSGKDAKSALVVHLTVGEAEPLARRIPVP